NLLSKILEVLKNNGSVVYVIIEASKKLVIKKLLQKLNQEHLLLYVIIHLLNYHPNAHDNDDADILNLPLN
ncbi:hypothetical protein HZS_2464, partial [Henneguya salminicola]